MTGAPTRALVVTAVLAEADAVLAGLPGDPEAPARVGTLTLRRVDAGNLAVDVLAAGVGPAAAAAGTALALAAATPDAAAPPPAGSATTGAGYDLVVNLGVAGGFAGRGVRVGDVVVADRVTWADLGADSDAGPIPAADLGWTEASPPVAGTLAAQAATRVAALGLRVHLGSVLTVATATGTAARAAWLDGRFGAHAEAMEGAGVLHAAALLGVPALEVRTVSNLVGPRDPSGWDLPAALAVLTDVASALLTVPLDRPVAAGPADALDPPGAVGGAGATASVPTAGSGRPARG